MVWKPWFTDPWTLRGQKRKRTLQKAPFSASPKPHPSKPPPLQHATSDNGSCAAIFGMLRCRNCTATLAFSAVQKSFGPRAVLQQTKNCTCNIEKAALQESGAFLPLSCGFQAPTFRNPRFGPADLSCDRFPARRLLHSFGAFRFMAHFRL